MKADSLLAQGNTESLSIRCGGGGSDGGGGGGDGGGGGGGGGHPTTKKSSPTINRCRQMRRLSTRQY